MYVCISNIPLSTFAELLRRNLTVGANVDLLAVKTCSMNMFNNDYHLIMLNPQHMFTCTTLDLNRALSKESKNNLQLGHTRPYCIPVGMRSFVWLWGTL